MAILAHRGITAVARDNSYAAIEALAHAVDAGLPMGIEVDVRRTLDEQLVMNHNFDEQTFVLARNSLAQLNDVFAEQDLITLDTALQLLTNVSVVNLEVKEPKSAEATVAGVLRHCEQTGKPIDQFVLSSFVPWIAEEIRRLEPSITTGLLVDRNLVTEQDLGEQGIVDRLLAGDSTLTESAEWVLRLAEYSTADGVHAHWSHASQPFFDGVKSLGKRLSFWTVNNSDLLNLLVAHEDVLHVVTDYPHLVYGELTPVRPHRKMVTADLTT